MKEVRAQLAQAQASLAAARAQALEEAANVRVGWIDDDFLKSGSTGLSKPFADAIRALITPSDSTALAKLLAEERPPKDSPITLLVNALHDPRWQEESSQIARAIADKARAEVDRYLQIPQTPVARVAELKGEQR